MKNRTRASNERGFTLIAVLLILAVLLGGLLFVLHDAGLGLREVNTARSKEMVAGAMDHGLAEALDVLQILDPDDLVDTVNPATPVNWDMFNTWGNMSFACPGTPPVVCPARGLSAPPAGEFFQYPPTGPYANELNVRVGLQLGQKTRPPSGEDVNTTYGYVVEVELAVSRSNSGADTAERATVGVRLPHVYSHN